MYSQVGSRGLPWTSVKSDSVRRWGRPASHARVAGSIVLRVHSIARRASWLKAVDLVAPDRRRVMVAADADRLDVGQPADDAVGIRPVADHVAEMPDGVDRADRGQDGVERDEIRMDVGQDGDPHRESVPQFAVGALARSEGARRRVAWRAQSGCRRRTAGSRG